MKLSNVFIALSLIASSASAMTRKEIRQKTQNHVFRVYSEFGGGGTAFFLIDKNNNIRLVTNAHVCLSKNMIMPDLRSSLTVIKINKDLDLCELSIPKYKGGLSLNKTFLLPGDTVFASGYPKLDPLVVTEGEVYARQEVTSCETEGKDCTTLEAYLTTVQVLPGNSGSPLLNENGDVVGVVFAREGMNGWGAVIPLAILNQFLYSP